MRHHPQETILECDIWSSGDMKTMKSSRLGLQDVELKANNLMLHIADDVKVYEAPSKRDYKLEITDEDTCLASEL